MRQTEQIGRSKTEMGMPAQKYKYVHRNQLDDEKPNGQQE